MGDITDLTDDQWDALAEWYRGPGRKDNAPFDRVVWNAIGDILANRDPVSVRPWQPGDWFVDPETDACRIVMMDGDKGLVIMWDTDTASFDSSADWEDSDGWGERIDPPASWVAAGRPGAVTDRYEIGVNDTHDLWANEVGRALYGDEWPGDFASGISDLIPLIRPVGEATIEPDWEEVAAAIDQTHARTSKALFSLRSDDFTDAVRAVVGPLLAAPTGDEDVLAAVARACEAFYYLPHVNGAVSDSDIVEVRGEASAAIDEALAVLHPLIDRPLTAKQHELP